MFRPFAIGGALVASSLALASPALAKPSPKAVHHTRASASVRHSQAVVHPNTTSSTPPALYVNGTTGTDASNNCRTSSHPCQTISYALTQAGSGATINVAAGTYPEQLTITQNVLIHGVLSHNQPAVIIRPTSVSQIDTDPDSTTQPPYPIVDVQSGVTSGSLSDVEIDGSGASAQQDSNGQSCAQDYIGIYYHNASGALNTDRVTGIENPPDLFGCQGGLGIYAATSTGSTTASHVTMSAVTVDHYDKNGITCDDVGTVCTITGSTVTGLGPIPTNSNPNENVGQNGIQFADSAGSITSSVVTGNSYTNPDYCPTGTCSNGGPSSTYYDATGILILDAGNVSLTSDISNRNDENVYAGWDPSAFGDSAPPSTQGAWTITSSNVSNAVNNTGTVTGTSRVADYSGFGDGLDVDGAQHANIHGNTAWGDDSYGIGVFATSNSTVLGNRTSKANSGGVTYQDGEGIYVGDSANDAVNQSTDSSHNSIQSNTSDNNVLDGIFADTYSSNNTFSNNTLDNNGHYDAEDQSTGPGTSGTADTWTGNACLPKGDSNPPGLCNK